MEKDFGQKPKKKKYKSYRTKSSPKEAQDIAELREKIELHNGLLKYQELIDFYYISSK